MKVKRNDGGSQGRHFSVAESMRVEVEWSCSDDGDWHASIELPSKLKISGIKEQQIKNWDNFF